MTLYKISAFSRLGQVSIKALRLYDQRGLLKPTKVDAETGYRYYRLDQLPRLHRLLALKAMGFSLEQIGQMLSDDLSLTQMQTMLQLRQAELQQQLQGTQASLAAVAAHLKYIQEEKTMPEYEIILKSVEPIQHVISIREIIPAYTAVGKLFGNLNQYLSQNNALETMPDNGYCASIWHSPAGKGYQEDSVDAEAIIAAPTSVTASDNIQVKDLPALDLVAAVIHRGPYTTLNQPYAAIIQWIEDNPYQIIGANREVYLRGGTEQDNANYVTEIQFPVKKITG